MQPAGLRCRAAQINHGNQAAVFADGHPAPPYPVRVFRVFRGSMSVSTATATAIKSAAVMASTVKSSAMMMTARTGIVMVAVMMVMRLSRVGIVAAQKPEAAGIGRRTAFAPRAFCEKNKQRHRHAKDQKHVKWFHALDC
jgi:hypothetical protein